MLHTLKLRIYDLYLGKYNIGFIDNTFEDLVKPKQTKQTKKVYPKHVKWLKHPYRDRWFADPFVLDVSNNEITLLAEEQDTCLTAPGKLVKLVIDQTTKELKHKSTILELPTHLSYPLIIRENNKVYVLPENGASNSLNLYELGVDDKLHWVKRLIDRPLYDSTPFLNPHDKQWYIVGTEIDGSQLNAYLYKSTSITEEFTLCNSAPISSDLRYARSGGNFFVDNDNQIYRMAQDCNGSYGNSIHIMKIDSVEPFMEHEVCHLKPKSFRYNLGLHTLQFHQSGLTVIDGTGHNHPILGRIIAKPLEKITNLLIRITH